MSSSGWVVDVNNADTVRSNGIYNNLCGSSTFWGYKLGFPVGRVTTTFKGSGKATLSFGECWIKGTTKVYLNDKQIGIALPRQLGIVVSFEYGQGDTLKLEEEGAGIIKIDYLKLTCIGNLMKHFKLILLNQT